MKLEFIRVDLCHSWQSCLSCYGGAEGDTLKSVAKSSTEGVYQKKLKKIRAKQGTSVFLYKGH
jgi:RNA:NAD 2'-phosphotransferase (TPT1/KptA family)